MQRAYRIQIYNARDGWRWRMLAPNNRIVAESGEAYTRKASASRAASRLIIGTSMMRCAWPL